MTAFVTTDLECLMFLLRHHKEKPADRFAAARCETMDNTKVTLEIYVLSEGISAICSAQDKTLFVYKKGYSSMPQYVQKH